MMLTVSFLLVGLIVWRLCDRKNPPRIVKDIQMVKHVLFKPEIKVIPSTCLPPYDQSLRRRKSLVILELPYGEDMQTYAYEYWCHCGTPLTDGPSGAGSVNMVCETCKVNYGCLDGTSSDRSSNTERLEPLKL